MPHNIASAEKRQNIQKKLNEINDWLLLVVPVS